MPQVIVASSVSCGLVFDLVFFCWVGFKVTHACSLFGRLMFVGVCSDGSLVFVGA